MNILLISHRFYQDSKGGTEVLTQDIAQHLICKGYKVIWLAVGNNNDEEINITHLDNGIIMCKISPQFKYNYPLNWMSEESCQAKKISKVLCNLKLTFDIVHIFHFARIGLNFLTLDCFKKSKIFFTLTDYTAICPDYQLFIRKRKKICNEFNNFAQCITCIESDASEEEVSNWKKRNIDFINSRAKMVYTQTPYQRSIMANNGIDEKLLSPLFAKYMIPKEWKDSVNNEKRKRPFRFCYIGRISPEKGIDIVLDAFCRFGKNRPYEFHIYGAYDFDDDYNELVKKMIIKNEKIQYFEPVSLIKLGEIIKEIDCLLIPSLWLENHPLVLTYGLSFNKFVLCSEVPSLIHLKDYEKLLFVNDYESSDAWCMAMKNIIKRNNLIFDEKFSLSNAKDEFRFFVENLIEEYNN